MASLESKCLLVLNQKHDNSNDRLGEMKLLKGRATRNTTKYHGRRAVSVIVGALIMVIIVVATATVIFAYANNSFANLSSSSNNLFANSGNALEEQFKIAYTSFNLTSGGVALFIQNFGTNPVSISAVYVLNEATGLLVKNLEIANPVVVEPGSIQQIFINFTPTHGLAYEFIAVTLLGTQVTTVGIA